MSVFPRLAVQRARKRFANLAKQDPGRAGRVVKQDQEENSPNHIQAIFGASVLVHDL